MRAAREGLRAGVSIADWRELADRALLSVAMLEFDGNQCKMARELQTHRNTMWRTLVNYGLLKDAKRLRRGRSHK